MPQSRVGKYTLNYVEDGSGFPLVLIHGLAGDLSAWKPQMPEFAKRHRTVALDNRGAGKSTQIEEAVSTQDLARDTLSLMDALDIERAHVLGRSMGGSIAQHMALLAPDRIQSLTMCASFAKLDSLGYRVLTNMREVLEWRGWNDHARHSVANFLSPRFYNENPEIVTRIEGLIGDESRLPACYVAQNHACLMHDTLDRLGDITCPTLILAGGRDPICSRTATAWMSERIPNSRTEIFEDSSHFFLLEEPERFMSVMLEWLGEHTP
jgi:pimeloyl-ACP methyl ester carboxylesterase